MVDLTADPWSTVSEKPPPPNARDLDPNTLIHFGGPIDRACVGLRLFGDSLVPEDVTRLLGCPPTVARRKGDVIPDKRYRRIASTGIWRLDGVLPKETDIEKQVTALLSAVTGDLQTWQYLTTEFDVDIFCGVFLDDANRGFWLSPSVMKMMSERGIEIGFDIYCNEDTE